MRMVGGSGRGRHARSLLFVSTVALLVAMIGPGPASASTRSTMAAGLGRGSASQVARNADGRLEVFCSCVSGHRGIQHTWQLWPGGPWSPWSDLSDVSDMSGP